MKRFKIILLLFVLVFNQNIYAQKKIALLIGIGKYPEGQRYWRNLSSERDLQYMKAALLENGFTENNIVTIVNEKATKKAMVVALDKLADKAMAGDIVYFHFSGHGQQIQDDAKDGKLDEADGYDEALIPYDAKGMWDEVDYKGQNHFRDDLLEEKLIAIRRKVGSKGSVVVVLDACHSGTATRSASIVRGVPEPCKSNNYTPNINLNLSITETGFLSSIKEKLGSLVVFSGSSPNQANKETTDKNGKSVGSLSYAFSKAITNLPINCNYNLLFEKVKATVQADEPTQIPMFEGNGTLKVFSNQFIPLKDIIAVEQRFNNAANNFNDTTFVIQRGQFNNINTGTELNVYVMGTTELYCKAFVQQANNFQSICIATKKLSNKNTYEVKVESLVYGAVTASYNIQNKIPTATNAIEKQLQHFLQQQPFLLKNNNSDYTLNISQENNSTYIQLIEKNDSVRYSSKFSTNDSLSANNLEDLLESIKKGMRVKYLRKMEDGGSLYNNVQVTIHPLQKAVSDNELIFYPNDSFQLKIKSNYDGILYFTVLDLLPDNNIKILIPDTSKLANDADYSLRKNEERQFTIYTDETSITGKEFLKVIFSPYPIDLRPSFQLYSTRTINTKLKPIEKAMDDLFPKNKNTLTRSTPVKMDDIAIKTVGFTLRKSK